MSYFRKGGLFWGEAAWTARDLVAEYLLTNAFGDDFGRFGSELDALKRRDYLRAEGVECWVVPIENVEGASCS